jgi:hypothetical protein
MSLSSSSNSFYHHTNTHTHSGDLLILLLSLFLSILYNFILDFFTIPVTVFISFIFIISSLSFFSVKFLMYLFSSFFLKSATKTSLSKKILKAENGGALFSPYFFKCNFSIFFYCKKIVNYSVAVHFKLFYPCIFFVNNESMNKI